MQHMNDARKEDNDLWPRRPAMNLLNVAARAKEGCSYMQAGGASVVTARRKKTTNHMYGTLINFRVILISIYIIIDKIISS